MAAACGTALAGTRLDSKLATSLLPHTGGLLSSSSCELNNGAFRAAAVVSKPLRKLLHVVSMAPPKPSGKAERVVGIVKLALEAGKATPAPPVGPALGSKGVNIKAFRKEYNAKTADKPGYVIPVEITVFDDRSFTKHPALATRRSFSPSSSHHSRGCSRLRRNLLLRTLETSSKRALPDDTPAELAPAEDDEEEFTEEEDASLEESTSFTSSTEDFQNQAWNHKYLLALAGLPGIFSGLESSGSVIQSIAVLAAVISVHEAGHFLAARLQGIHVTKFAIGFGPTLAKYQGKEVEYSLRAIPLGGYVAFPDDDPNSGFQPDDPDLLKNRGIPARALVISAGVIANIIFAYSVLFGQVLTVGLVEQEYLPGVIIPEIIGRSAASRGGLEAGDVVLSVGGRTLDKNVGAVFELVDTIKDNPGRSLNFEVRRAGFPDLLNIKITPDLAYDGAGKIGVQLSTNASLHRVKASNLGEAVAKASKEFMRLSTTVTEGLKQVFFNFAQTADKLSGPVAIVAVGAEVARSDIAGLFQFAAIVNINLAVVNVLPLPALDGGYLFLIALEALRGKKLPEGVEKGIMSSGILLLLVVGVVLMVRDTLNLGIVQQLL